MLLFSIVIKIIAFFYYCFFGLITFRDSPAIYLLYVIYRNKIHFIYTAYNPTT